jgi:hypothetical protein
MATIEGLLHRRSDLSAFVVHFTRDTFPTSAKDNLLSILRSCRLEARTTYGMAKTLADRFPEIAAMQRTVCFTEVPLEHAWMMCQPIDGRSIQFNGYGLAFTRTFARRRGANPVWYLDITPGHDWLTGPVQQLLEDAEATAYRTGADDPFSPDEPDITKLVAAPILQLTPFIEQMGQPGGTRKEFWWEREWRHVGDLGFAPTDLVVVFAPENEHDSLRTSLATNPSYRARMPALVDAQWGLERMIGTLARVPDLGPFPQQAASG